MRFQIKKMELLNVIIVELIVNERNWMIDPNFVITPELFEKCTTFGLQSGSTSADAYAKRNQKDLSKIEKDIRNGKIAEQAVHDKLVSLYPNLSLPDFNIYSKKDKSWDPDLKDSSGLRVAVKSQEAASALAYGESWVFEYGTSNSKGDVGIFGKDIAKHYVCFVNLNITKLIGSIRAIVSVEWLRNNDLFKPMKLSYLTSKRAVYYSDLEKFENLWQLGE
jgi:hypothetical protein